MVIAMLGPDAETLTLITNIQLHTDDHVRRAFDLVDELGGPSARDQFLSHALCTLIAVATKARGPAGAIALMVEGFETAEGMSEGP
jgi:hypothetical protein